VSLPLLVTLAMLTLAAQAMRASPAEGSRDMRAQDLSRKVIPEPIRAEVEAALAHFPALKDTPIIFRFKSDIKRSMMQAQPRGLFKGRSGRSYVINMSERFFIDNTSYSIREIPSDVLIGWLVHELGHVMDYHQRSSMGLVAFGIKYVTFGSYLRKAERAADTYAVDHGCGHYLVQCKEYILGNEELPEAYRNKIRRSYLCPETIRTMVLERTPSAPQPF
jgi:hypothetical protein